MQNKINHFNRANKTPQYNSRNLVFQGKKYIEFKTPKSRNSSKDNIIKEKSSNSHQRDSNTDIFIFNEELITSANTNQS